jgi:hypothetical protein
LLHPCWSYYNMHFSYTIFIYCFALIWWVQFFKVGLGLFILCLDQPGFTLSWVELARALPWFRVVYWTFINLDYLCYHSYKATTLYACYSKHGESPRKTVQPQEIWLCLGWLTRKLGVRKVLPEKGWG